MAIRNAQPIPYSSPIFYGEGELSFNEQIAQECNFYASPMCLPWDSSESFCFQFLAGEKGDNLLNCLPFISGTATATGVNLIDATKSFANDGISVGQLLFNATTGDTYSVTLVSTAPGDTFLNLTGTPSTGTNRFTTGDSYQIYPYILVDTTQTDTVEIQFDRSICFTNFISALTIKVFPAVNIFHRITVDIYGYQQGRLDLFREGTAPNEIANYQSPGTFDSWFRTPVSKLQFVGDGDNPFTGCVNMCNTEIYDVQSNYSYKINDGSWVPFTYLGNAIRSGVIEKCIDLPEGCDVTVCLGSDLQCGEFQTIGEVGNWNTNIAAGITLVGNQVCFNGSSRGDSAFAEGIGCDISTIVTNVQFELTISGHGTGNIQVCIENNDLSGQVCSSPYASNGLHTFTLSNFGMNVGPKRIIIKAHSNNVTLCATLKYKIQNFQPETFACSECYHVKQLDCETELTWNNDTNSFGHAYNTGYTNRMYVEGRLLNGKIVSLAHDERKGVDSYQRSFFSNGRKVEELAIDAIFPAAHQAIAVGLMHRNFYVNGVQYVKIGEYEPDYGDTAEIAPCVVEVAKKDQRYIVNPL